MKKLRNPFRKVAICEKFSVVRRFPENTEIPLIILAFKMMATTLGLFKLAFIDDGIGKVMKPEDCD